MNSAEVAPTSANVDKSPLYHGKLPPNVPRVIVENTINIQDARKVLPWHRDERRRQFNLLVRKYKNQLLYGCQNPACLTPTCASFRKRATEGPYRRYTELSARTLACYLASVDNAEDGLCLNSPIVPLELPSQDNSWRSKRGTQAPTVGRGANSPGALTPAGQVGIGGKPKHFNVNEDDSSAVLPSLDEQSQSGVVKGLHGASSQRIKDPKSFTQTLFDTLALRMVEWLPLRRASVHSEEHTPSLSNSKSQMRNSSCHKLVETAKHFAQGRNHMVAERSGNIPQTASSRVLPANNGFVDMKFPNQHLQRLSVTDIDRWRQFPPYHNEEKIRPDSRPTQKFSFSTHTNTSNATSKSCSPVLKPRPQKHKIRPINTNDELICEQNSPRRVSWDGAKLFNEALGSNHVRDEKAFKDPISFRKDDVHREPNLAAPIAVPFVQTITHLSAEIVDGFTQMIGKCDEDAERWKEEMFYIELAGSFNDFEWRVSTPHQRQAFTFITQSVFYVLSNTGNILRSYRKAGTDPNEPIEMQTHPQIDFARLETSLCQLSTVCPWDLAFHSLWVALEKLFVPPRDLSQPMKKPRQRLRISKTDSGAANPVVVRRVSDTGEDDHISDSHAAYVATMALFILVTSIPKTDIQTWRAILQMRAAGTVTPGAEMQRFTSATVRSILAVTDRFEHELALRLLDRLVRAITARLTYHEIAKSRRSYTPDSPKQCKMSVLDLILDHLTQQYRAKLIETSPQQSPGSAAIIVEWFRTLFLREWDGKPEISRSSATGGVVQILASMYKERSRLGLVPEDFHTYILSDRLDPMEMPADWLYRLSNNRTLHLLSYSFLFPPSALVIYFRALNYSSMSKQYEAAMTTSRHVTQTAFSAIHVQDDVGLLARLTTSMSNYLVLNVRRSNVLLDALNQLWRRERRELLRPLKVQMGMDEGEEGIDHGGVQQEFFRVVMAECLDPAYGMFTMDSRTRISWFQPCSLEPPYKFELLGLLVSLAIYNGITLPINFPISLYRKLLALKVNKLDHIRDGWAELAKGLEDLLKWDDGDVEDVFLRTYEFSFEAFGRVVTVDMQEVSRDAVWSQTQNGQGANLESSDGCPLISSGSRKDSKSFNTMASFQTRPPPTKEAALVTNLNRDQFVKDYVFWLTDKSIRPQYDAFARGFYTCLDRSALSIFTPEALKRVVEGIQEIDVYELEQHARYEGGFGPSHRVIRDFWSIVKQFSPEKKAQLLEFVTASDRVPVNGIASIMFVIQRNGVGDARLPSSLTCFGRLLLPEYSSRAILEEKLNKALENARGFGVA